MPFINREFVNVVKAFRDTGNFCLEDSKALARNKAEVIKPLRDVLFELHWKLAEFVDKLPDESKQEYVAIISDIPRLHAEININNNQEN